MKKQSRPVQKWWYLLALMAGVSITIMAARTVASWMANHTQTSQTSDETTQTSTVSIETQLNVPLQISSVEIDVTRPMLPRLNLVLTNISSAPIRAFTIRRTAANGSNYQTGVTLMNMMSLDQILEPSQSRPISVVGKTKEEIAKGLALGIDFVEFIDGTTWGEDKFDSAEELAGQRAGGKAALKYLQETLRTNGISGVANEVSKDDLEVLVPPNHSQRWEMGFRTGISMVKERIRRSYQKSGEAQLKIELQQPYDASAGRKLQ